MEFPENLFYSESHEWLKVGDPTLRDEGSQVTIGLTDYAQSQLKDIVYVELPEIGSEFKRGESMGVVESVKTVADVYSPITGKVVETNLSLKDSPQFINEDPYGKGWIVKMEIRDKEELKGLLSSRTYQDLVSKEE
jgi:glycine cleavage system H protein